MANKTHEKEWQDAVIALFTSLNAHAVNVEPGITNPGMPDINWCYQGIEGNLELKIAYDEGAGPHIRPNQIVWFRERVKAGGYPMFGVYVKSKTYSDEVYVIQGRYVTELADYSNNWDAVLANVPHLRVMRPEEFVQALISEMASWHDEIDPPGPEIITPH